jgi:16S rRNA processing protein RimM
MAFFSPDFQFTRFILCSMNLIPAGKLQKTFGAHGELLLALYGEGATISQKLPVFISVDGLDVPFYFKSITEKGGKFVVIFDDMEQEALAKELVGKEIFAAQTVRSRASTSPAESDRMLGYTFADATFGVIGKLARRLDYQGNPVLEIATGQGKEILIPDNPDFITAVDNKKKIVSVNLPEGLIEMYLQ